MHVDQNEKADVREVILLMLSHLSGVSRNETDLFIARLAIIPAPANKVNSSCRLLVAVSPLRYLNPGTDQFAHDDLDMHAAWHQGEINFTSVNDNVPVTEFDSWHMIVLCSMLHGRRSELGVPSSKHLCQTHPPTASIPRHNLKS